MQYTFVRTQEKKDGYTFEQPVERINGLTYFEYSVDSYERQNWRKIQMDCGTFVGCGDSGFESFLHSKGYRLKVYRNRELVSVKRFTLSFMGDSAAYYIKDNQTVIYGLKEKGKPPTLLSPLPQVFVKRETGTKSNTHQSSIEVMFQQESYEQIYEAMFDQSIVFRYDLTT
jgi:hypothetical protein